MSKTILNCTQQTAAILFILIGSLFIFTGCVQVYKLLGLTEEQTEQLLAEDQKTIIHTITQVRTTAAEIITTTIAGLGAIVSGFLAKWLHTERKITKVLITGVESADSSNIKKTIKAKATAAGIEPKLAARVQALT
ncbi:hypothetical protein ES703_95319 [subsurface metagenome]